MSNHKNFPRETAFKGMTAAVMVLVGLHMSPAQAANIMVTNVLLDKVVLGQNYVKFDVSWDASWRASWTETSITPNITITNWDAAWIFVKYRVAGSTSSWSHATLSTNNSDHVAPAGSTINVGLSTNTGGTNFGAGVFLYRSTVGNGSWTNTGVKLRWRYADDGVANVAHVDVSVHAIEMVYVPQGSFYAGDGTTLNTNGQFENGQFTNAFLVTNDNYIIYLGGGTNGNMGNRNRVGMYALEDDFNNTTTVLLPAAFPKGYNAFYCMKYETSQGQYADFLNQLAYAQATNRYPSYSDKRYTISGSYPNYSASAHTRACNYLCWADGAAYADWAGLRPMTELEYEKACRGPLSPVAEEYAWGTTTITQQTGYVGTDGSGTEAALPAGADCNYNSNATNGPVRCGLFATTNAGRVLAGSTYWGIMEMSGNVRELTVTVGNSTGRKFAGAHGNGRLDSNGNADAPLWPDTTATGTGNRGGNWLENALFLRTSDRRYAGRVISDRSAYIGWRAVRSAP